MLNRKLACLMALAIVVVGIATFTGCNTEELEEPFDFSKHMRIMPCFVELMERDFSEYEKRDHNQLHGGIQVRGFDGTDTMFVEDRRLRLRGSFDWGGGFSVCFGARLNGEIIAFGDPLFYERLKYGTEIPSISMGSTPFFVDLNLEEGLNIVEFISGLLPGGFLEPIDSLAIKTVYVYFQP